LSEFVAPARVLGKSAPSWRSFERTFLVEFSDEKGRAYAVVPCPRAALLVLHYVPEAA
jgi:hypothetical protein